jgi:hypothetical protein
MADHGTGGELYSGQLIGMLELVWGEGWLSPAGTRGSRHRDKGHRFPRQDRSQYRLQCRRRRFPSRRDHGALYVTGIDVEDTVLITPRHRAEAKGLAERCGFVKVWPGPLAFPPESFDIAKPRVRNWRT